MKGLETYDRRHGWRGAFGHVDSLNGWEDIARKTVRPREHADDWRRAVVVSVSGGAVSVRTVDGVEGALVGPDVAWARAGRGIGTGDLVFVAANPEGAGFRLKQIPKPSQKN